MFKFHLVMPMCGSGSRFMQCGFKHPKPLIQIYHKPFFYWATMSVLKFSEVIDITFIVLKEHNEVYGLDETIKELFPKATIVVLDHVLNGPVLTCIEGIKRIKDDYPILINDCDHLFKSDEFINYVNVNNCCEIDGGLITFKSSLPQYSYVLYDHNRIIGTVEKDVVSNDAICGAYLFKSASLFFELAEAYLNNCNYNEFFLSGMYNELAKRCGNIAKFSTKYHVSFGTPEEYEMALNDSHYMELK